jgi:hypothetical protein
MTARLNSPLRLGAGCCAAIVVCFVLFACFASFASFASAQTMPNLREMSGTPLPDPTMPAGTVSVRVVRGAISNNVPKQPVEFIIDGASRTVETDESGRAQVTGLKPGAKVRAVAVVDGERLETQEITIGSSGTRFILAARDPLASAAPVKGMVVFSGDSRVVAQFEQDRLEMFYILEISNTARTPVDIGGPVLIDLPREARGATVMQGSTPQASAKGSRVTVLGPFPPGITAVSIGFEMPYSGPVARIEQRWPIALPQITVLVAREAGLDVRSPQFTDTREMQGDNGQPLVLATGGGLAAGASLAFEVFGLPHHASWPRYVALALAGLIILIGVWAAVTAPRGV